MTLLLLITNFTDSLQVSIIAAVPCRYLYWQRSALEYLFIKETYLATVIGTLVATDITNKLYMMNNKVCALPEKYDMPLNYFQKIVSKYLF